MKWLVLGGLPPPLGGVTVFGQRWIARRRRCGASIASAYPLTVKGWIDLLYAVPKRPDFVVVNSLRWQLLLVALCCFPGSKKIAVDHNHSRRFIGDTSSFLCRVTVFLLNRFDRIWIVSEHLRSVHQTLGVHTEVRTRSPYLPPDISTYDESVGFFSEPLQKFLMQAGSNRLFCISAYRLVLDKDIDVYGFDLALQSFAQLLSRAPATKLAIFVADPAPTPAYIQARDLMQKLKLEPHVFWEEGQKPLWPMFLHADAFLRPSTTDGWSVSVSEALDLGCPVIASDVVPRQKQCQLFSRNKSGDLLAKMNDILDRPKRSTFKLHEEL